MVWQQFVPLVINCSTDNRHSHWKLARTCIGALPLPDFSATIAAKFQLAAYLWKLDFPRARPESTVPRWVPFDVLGPYWVPIYISARATWCSNMANSWTLDVSRWYGECETVMDNKHDCKGWEPLYVVPRNSSCCDWTWTQMLERDVNFYAIEHRS